MKYPTTMAEATQAAHEARSEAFFSVFDWLGRPLRLLISFIALKGQKLRFAADQPTAPAPARKPPCTP